MSAALAVCDQAVAIGRDRAVLDRIVRPDVHLAVWQRDGVVAMDDLDWTEIADIGEDLAVDGLASAIPMLLVAAGYPDACVLAAEIVPLATHFASLMACGTLRVRLDVIQTDACRKFHADNVTVRLLMPMVGPGTQWMRAGAATHHPEDQLQIGDVGLFKGRLWAEQPVILHRSPPIATTGVTRLLLVIDPL